jgi:hypothetical protein
MKLLILSLFVAANIAFAAFGFRVWKYDKLKKTPVYFSIFSLFAAFYFFFVALDVFPNREMGSLIVLCWLVMYAMLPWFLRDHIGRQRKVVSIGLSSLFFVAFIFFFFRINLLGIITWQHLAHLGLIGLVLTGLLGSIDLKSKENSGWSVYFALVLIFTLLVFEQIVTTYSHRSFLESYTFGIVPLDLFPIIFSGFMVKKLYGGHGFSSK